MFRPSTISYTLTDLQYILELVGDTVTEINLSMIVSVSDSGGNFTQYFSQMKSQKKPVLPGPDGGVVCTQIWFGYRVCHSILKTPTHF